MNTRIYACENVFFWPAAGVRTGAWSSRGRPARFRHGYPVGWIRVPERLRRKWMDEGRVRRRDIRAHWD